VNVMKLAFSIINCVRYKRLFPSVQENFPSVTSAAKPVPKAYALQSRNLKRKTKHSGSFFGKNYINRDYIQVNKMLFAKGIFHVISFLLENKNRNKQTNIPTT